MLYIVGVTDPSPSPHLPVPSVVCGVLLRHLDLGKEVAWCESLKRIRSIVGGVDYKVRLWAE